MKEVHLVRVKNGFVLKFIDHILRSETLEVYTQVDDALAAAGDFVGSAARAPTIAIPTPANT